jgi:fused signal recognition particle receptor
MFSILKSKKNNEKSDQGIFSTLKQGLNKTRTQLMGGISTLLFGKKVIDKELLDAIETQLLLADVGVEVTQHVIASLTKKISRKELHDPAALIVGLKQELRDILNVNPKKLTVTLKPTVVLVVGVNGTGKTTTIGKLAKHFQNEQLQVMLAAGDTFRAAAIEQLQIWGERNAIPVVAQHMGADSASVIFDALQSTTVRKIDLLIADTAGRLHTQSNLMEELKKIKRVLTKLDSLAPHETVLVLDATTGQNALRQAQQFHEAIGVTGIIITKLDGTAKGGIIFAIAKKLALPIYFIGVGEKIDDLLPFDAESFVNALFE